SLCRASARLWRLSAPLGSSVVAHPGAAVERTAIPCAMRRTASMLGPCARHWLRSPVAVAATHCRRLGLPCTTTAFNAALAAKCTCSSVRSRHASRVSAAMIVVSFLFVEDIACRVFPLDYYRWTDIKH